MRSVKDRMVETFCELVRIDSESGGERAFLDDLTSLLEERLDAMCAHDEYGNLAAHLKGKNSDRDRPCLFACHADTVKPGKGIEPVLDADVIRSRGDTVLGADDKAGIAEFIQPVEAADRHPPIEFVVTREEEVGLVGVRHLGFGTIAAKEGFVLDADKLDVIVVGGPSHFLIDATLLGKAAHAGMEPEKGISSIVAASRAVAALPLGRLDGGTTANVGIIDGGLIRNGVPETTKAAAECRSLSHERATQACRLMEEICTVNARSVGASAEVRSELAYRAHSIPESATVVAVAKGAIRSVGLEPVVQGICGGTDASIYNEKGIQTVVLGTGIQAERSCDAHVRVSDMRRGVEIIRHVFSAMAKGGTDARA
jgi:tripeptide aminopeptidase